MEAGELHHSHPMEKPGRQEYWTYLLQFLRHSLTHFHEQNSDRQWKGASPVMEEVEQRPTAPQTCCSGRATTAFMISGTYCFTRSLRQQ